MKKLMILLFVLFASTSIMFAQKFAYVDSEGILKEIPEYKEAQTKLDKLAERWQQEIQEKYDEVDRMYKAYQAEQVLLTDEMKNKKEEEIILQEKSIKDFQKAKFGPNGELFKKRQDLIRPIQDKVYDAIQKLAKQRAYDFIFDKSGGAAILFADPKFDKSADVLKMIE